MLEPGISLAGKPVTAAGLFLSLQLRLAVVEALGPMSPLMPSDKLEEQLSRLIPGILALYKKHAEAFYVSKVNSFARCTPVLQGHCLVYPLPPVFSGGVLSGALTD